MNQQFQAKYIYGIINSNKQVNFNAKAIGTKGEIYLVPFKDISAIVSDTVFDEFDPTDDNLLAHETVLQEALLEKELNVAPMRFCTIVAGRNDIFKLLQSGYFAFKKNLLRVKDKTEFGVKLFVDIQKMRQEFGEKTIDKSKEIAEKFHEELKPFAVADYLNELPTEDMVMNASFLINRGDEQKLKDKLIELDKQFTDFLTIRFYGPGAPYNFVSMPTK